LEHTAASDCLLALTAADFYKSMESEAVPGLWQDVYRPVFEGLALYVKLQIWADGLVVVISFKEL
jgi:motility quorum-sensing regulator / GCU-specific mRNA interferase toxin